MEEQQASQVGKLGIVFWVSVGFSVIFLLWGAIFTGNLSTVTSAILNFVLNNFGWLYLVATTLFLFFVIYLAFSRFGKIKLGKDDEEPEFGRLSWFAMLFAAGMGIGLVFWGVAEPMSHYGTPPYNLAEPRTPDAAELGLRYSFFHWGLHPWAVYAVIAMCLAYFNFRREQGGIISSIFRPILGDRVDGPIGNVIDVLAIVATLFGVAVSLGLGALQVNGGLNFLFDVPNTATVQIIIIAIIFVFYMTSAATGIGKGIRYLSNLNMVLGVLLVLFIFVVGPTVLIIGSFVQVAGSYVASVVPMSFEQNVFTDSTWANDWTLFYWATWIAWCPFVGTFIARISRGRTIREFVIVVLLVPTVVGMFWFSTFGAGGRLRGPSDGRSHHQCRIGECDQRAVCYAGAVPTGDRHVYYSDGPGQRVLYHLGRLGVVCSGQHVDRRCPKPQDLGQVRLGVHHSRLRGGGAAGRRAGRPAKGGHHSRGAVRGHHDRDVLLSVRGVDEGRSPRGDPRLGR